MLRIAFTIGNIEVLLNAKEAEQLLLLIEGKPAIKSSYEKTGDNGKYETVHLLTTFSHKEGSRIRLLTEDEYSALKFFTEAFEAAKTAA